jgi:hypothetical protein
MHAGNWVDEAQRFTTNAQVPGDGDQLAASQSLYKTTISA